MADLEAAAWQEYKRTRDPDLRDQLIRTHIGLVRRVAGRLIMHLPPHVEQADLESAGIPGLLAAVEGFDPARDTHFASYAQVRIRGAMLDEIRAQDPVARSVRTSARAIARARERLEHQLLRAPDAEEIALGAGLDLEDYYEVLQRLRGGLSVSVDTALPWSGEEGIEDSDAPVLAAQTPDPWQRLAANQRAQLLGQYIDALPKTERLTLSLYYHEQLTMAEVAAVLGVTESRVSQIHRSAVHRIRARLTQARISRDDLRLPAAGGDHSAKMVSVP